MWDGNIVMGESKEEDKESWESVALGHNTAKDEEVGFANKIQ